MASGTSSAGKPVAAASGLSSGRDQIHRARAPEHADGDEDADEERDDLHRHLESLAGPFDEHVVDLHAAHEPDERDADEQDRNRPERDRLEDAAHQWFPPAGAAAAAGAIG